MGWLCVCVCVCVMGRVTLATDRPQDHKTTRPQVVTWRLASFAGRKHVTLGAGATIFSMKGPAKVAEVAFRLLGPDRAYNPNTVHKANCRSDGCIESFRFGATHGICKLKGELQESPYLSPVAVHEAVSIGHIGSQRVHPTPHADRSLNAPLCSLRTPHTGTRATGMSVPPRAAQVLLRPRTTAGGRATCGTSREA